MEYTTNARCFIRGQVVKLSTQVIRGSQLVLISSDLQYGDGGVQLPTLGVVWKWSLFPLGFFSPTGAPWCSISAAPCSHSQERSEQHIYYTHANNNLTKMFTGLWLYEPVGRAVTRSSLEREV